MIEKIQKYLPTPLILLAFAVSFFTIYQTGSPLFKEPDIGWHIAAGDLIRTLGYVPMHDSWSFSGSQQTWYNLAWLWDVIISFVHDHIGMQGLFIFTAALPALLVALILASLRRRGEIGINALVFTGMVTTYCMLEFSTGRPQIAAMFLAFIFHNILHSSRNNPHTWKLFLLPPLMVLWANIHGSYVAGFVAIGAYGLETIYSKDVKWFKRLFIIGLLCIPTILLNPFGVGVVTGVLRTLDSVITKFIIEWRPFIFGDGLGVSLWFLVFMFFGNATNKNIPVADKLLAFIWFIGMLFSVRNIGFLSVYGSVYIAFNLPKDNQKDSNTRKISAWIYDKKYSPAIMGAIPAILLGSYLLLPVLGTAHYLEDPKDSPLPAINYVLENYKGKHVLNDWNYGGRMIYESKGKFPVFIDGRAGTVYDEKVLSAIIEFIQLNKGWEDVLQSYHIDVIFADNSRSFVKDYDNGLYHERWKQVYHDDMATIYEKK